jgi:uncharacterized membrane protein YphA (DoxX/SURF4 family)
MLALLAVTPDVVTQTFNSNQGGLNLKDQAVFRKIGVVSLRVTLALAFLSAVADRFGYWGATGKAHPNVAWGTYSAFLDYTRSMLWFLPDASISILGGLATALEVILAVGLLAGVYVRWFSLASSLLLVIFAIAMTFGFGVESPLSYSVWTASAAAFLLWSVENDNVPVARP